MGRKRQLYLDWIKAGGRDDRDAPHHEQYDECRRILCFGFPHKGVVCPAPVSVYGCPPVHHGYRSRLFIYRAFLRLQGHGEAYCQNSMLYPVFRNSVLCGTDVGREEAVRARGFDSGNLSGQYMVTYVVPVPFAGSLLFHTVIVGFHECLEAVGTGCFCRAAAVFCLCLSICLRDDRIYSREQ